jgi:hypothetical protein
VTQSGARWAGILIRLAPTGPTWNAVPAALTWNAVTPEFAWDDYGSIFIDDAQVISPGQGNVRSVLVFAGRVTELSSAWDDSVQAPVVSVTASGFTADLQNRSVGDEPWNVESVSARARRILALVGLPITIDIADTLADTLLSWRDVDSQGALGLLQEIAKSVDGVLWPAVHSSLGAYLFLEDPAERAALIHFVDDDGVISIEESDPTAAFKVSACDVLRDPVDWAQSVADLATRVNVTWKQQGVDDEGKNTTTDVTEHVIDPALELTHGTRAVSVSTELQSAADASNVAAQVMARTSSDAWRASGFTIDDDDLNTAAEDIALMLDLLDGTSRVGAPIIVNELPTWAPAGESTGVYLEGATYRFVGGRWVLELVVSSSVGLGGSAEWNQMDSDWTWNMWDPSITWNDIRGVSAE